MKFWLNATENVSLSIFRLFKVWYDADGYKEDSWRRKAKQVVVIDTSDL